MMPFEEQITNSLKEAMKAKDQLKADTLRAMKSALKYKQVEKKQEAVTETEALTIFQTLIKQRRESIEQYEASGRADAAAKEKQEIEIIQSFLPTPLSEAEIHSLVEAAIKKVSAKGMKEMGLVMKELTPQTLGRADGKVVSDLVKQKLAALSA